MWKNRLGYILVMAGCAVLLFFYSRPFLLYALLLMLGVAVGDFFLLRRDARNLQTEFEIRPAVRQGNTASLILKTSSKHRMLVAGQILLDAVVRNEMFDTVEQRKVQMHLQHTEESFEIPISANLSGEINIESAGVWISDLFKLFRFPGKNLRTIHTVIYPEDAPIRVEVSRKFVGASQDEGLVQSRKGNDPSETFDIREYMPGDDVRSIHWKLSSKTDTLIFRESSDPSRYHMVILPDFGLKQAGESASETELNAAVGIGAAVCRQLAAKGVAFCMAFPSASGIRLVEVRNQSDYRRMLSQWLAMRVQKNSGDGLKMFITEHLEHCFTRLLILSAGQYDQNLSILDGQISVTVLNASENREDVYVSRNGSCELMEIPAAHKNDRTYRIIC
ncbi:DUF58 domain-containing protein [Blautia sp. MSJ-19]|uniref:DUF58 domain-containing protein n=1 Tax=Blautia sp. MSJ-19 TaxID=2841517 RepID=UPI001C0F3AEA|nr:DUF58 domain-containing protein [Blautia sp. MSJ-19]MBU5481093.1 DUF58 domain-containing protein [Blautia sp. MSJ-19]